MKQVQDSVINQAFDEHRTLNGRPFLNLYVLPDECHILFIM